MAEEIGELVRRVVGRVLAERGGHAAAGARRPAGGVHVGGPGLRPGAAGGRPSSPPGSALLTAEDLARVPDGGHVALDPRTRITPLAADEARRRGIALDAGSPAGARLRVAVGADHGGFALKGELLRWIAEWGHTGLDLGTHDTSPVDYPDQAAAVARAVAEGNADLGVCIDGMGIGSAIAANKIPGARAATCWDEASARNAREHNFANVLSVGAGPLSAERVQVLLRAFLTTPEGAERHARRVAKIAELERLATGRSVPVRRVRLGGGADAR